MVAHISKAEIHCHIEGAASPELATKQAAKYGVDISGLIDGGFYVWSDFTEFLRAYDAVASLFRTPEDYAILAETYLTDLAAQNCIYSEIIISTDHARLVGLSEAEYIAGLAEGMERAEAKTGIVSRMIATGLRHGGPEAVERAAAYIANNPHPRVTGFGMAGDERMHRAQDFAKAFDTARDAGLSLTTHAGEFVGAQSVRESLDHLKPARIGHGVRAVEDGDLVRRLADEKVVLEVCPASNIALGVFANFDTHSFNTLRQAGIPVTLNSDDPPHFQSSLGREYQIASENFGLTDEELLMTTRCALEAAFVDEETRAQLLAKL
ncbi:MAG: adenosine deaminase [Pseudomonadota bacterium]